ncbi:hypothetical protein cypCar_00009094 [Cyprinus carpio]|nr:hypothetical protein cypCar_00009094 [Cyprinus carpio]
MDYRQKRKLSFLTIGLIFLLSGVEYAVILPTIWRYLQLLEAPPYFLGLGLSAFSFSGLVFGPVFGHWSDKTRATKTIILFSNVFEIVGNFMYFMGYSKWLLLSSRLVAGIGAGAGSSIFGFLTRTTLPDERAGVFAAVMACRQAGLLIGPAFNIFLRLCDFKLGPFVVNKYTSPGLFMCGMWVLMQFAVMVLYWDIPPLDSFPEQHMLLREVRGEEDEPLMSLEDEHMAAAEDSYGSFTPEQTETRLSSELPPSPPDSPSLDTSDPFENFSASQEFLREEVVVLLTAQFITLFNQTALEVKVVISLMKLLFFKTMVTPLTQNIWLRFELGNSVHVQLVWGGGKCRFSFLGALAEPVWLEDRVVLRWAAPSCSGACVLVPHLLWQIHKIMMVLSYEKLVEPPRVEHAEDSENGG